MERSKDTLLKRLRTYLSDGRNLVFVFMCLNSVTFIALEITLFALSGKVLSRLQGNTLAMWVLALAVLGVVETAAHSLSVYLMYKRTKWWRYSLVGSGLMYCFVLSLTAYVLSEIADTLGAIRDDIENSCTSAPVLGSLRLAYDLALQLCKPYSQKLSLIPQCSDSRCLPRFSTELSLLQQLEDSHDCGGVCTAGPKVVSSWELSATSCKAPLVEVVSQGRRIALAVIISALLTKTAAVVLIYCFALMRRTPQRRYPDIELPALGEAVDNKPSPPPAEMSFSAPISAYKQSPTKYPLSPPLSLPMSPIPRHQCDLSVSSSESSIRED